MDCCFEKIVCGKEIMEFQFISSCQKDGNKTFVSIPFNMWDTCCKKGLIPAKAVINDTTFECKLIPKGNGKYVLPINKAVYSKLSSEFEVRIIILEQLTRINNNSPYSKDNPIRNIDAINYLKQTSEGYCGQACIAMLAGISVEEAVKIMKSAKWQASISKVLEALDYLGFSHKKPVYTHGLKVDFPKCCIISVKGIPKNHLLVHFDGTFCDPTYNVMLDYQFENTISYIEISAH
jgi:hypothetical protein